jgi:tRNA(Ile)-lysidine synthase
MVDQNKNIEKSVLKTVEETILEFNMLNKNDAVLVGLSGGPDSVALLHILKDLEKKLFFKLGIAHLNHGIRDEAADKDEAFVLSLANSSDLPCYSEKVDAGKCRKALNLSLEHAARRLRYDFLHQTSKRHGYNKIALGHHFDDNAEMILMALFRGSGPRGVSGIPPVRDGKIIRPLIRLTRSDIENYINAKGLKTVVDESNFDTSHLRNKIRHQLLPLLRQEYNPKISQSLNRLSAILRTEEEWIDEFIRSVFESAILSRKKNELILSIPQIRQMHLAVRRRVLRLAVLQIKTSLKKITLCHIDKIIGLMEKGPIKGRLDLPDRILVLRRHDRLLISEKNRALREIKNYLTTSGCRDFCYFAAPPQTVYVRETGSVITFYEKDIDQISDICCSGQHVAFFDIKSITYPLVLRNFRPEDRFVPLGMPGDQSINKFLKNQRVVEDYRHNVIVLASGGQVIWVVGFRIDASVKATSSTRRVLVAENHPFLYEN